MPFGMVSPLAVPITTPFVKNNRLPVVSEIFAAVWLRSTVLLWTLITGVPVWKLISDPPQGKVYQLSYPPCQRLSRPCAFAVYAEENKDTTKQTKQLIKRRKGWELCIFVRAIPSSFVRSGSTSNKAFDPVGDLTTKSAPDPTPASARRRLPPHPRCWAC